MRILMPFFAGMGVGFLILLILLAVLLLTQQDHGYDPFTSQIEQASLEHRHA